MVDPQIDTVRHLHVLSSQLIRLRRSITPMLHLTCNIRDQDIQRSAAASAIPTKGKERGGSVVSLAGYPGIGANASVGSLSIPEGTPAPTPPPQTPGMGSGMGLGSSAIRGGLGVPGWATPREEPGSNRSYIPPPSQPQPQYSAGVTNLAGGSGPTTAGGYFSPLSKVYISDVIDHLEMVVSSMDQFVASTEHLTDYVFVRDLPS